jgi:hypothetical protein
MEYPIVDKRETPRRDADGNPVNPSIAIAALGTPAYFFQGPASSIATNLGSAGSVTKTGTIRDITPGP